MARYVLLGYGARMPDQTADPTASDGSLDRLLVELTASDELVYAVGLADPGFAQVVRVHDGCATVTDGPYDEPASAPARLGVIQAPSHDRALQVAARTAAILGPVELRPLAEAVEADPAR